MRCYTFQKYRPDPEDIHPIRFQEGSLASVSTEAWMIIFGDGFLDFIDGVSIGTGFQDSLLTGFSISLGILLEELPHELGMLSRKPFSIPRRRVLIYDV